MHITTTDLYKYPPDAVPPIQYVLSHVATDKDPSKYLYLYLYL